MLHLLQLQLCQWQLQLPERNMRHLHSSPKTLEILVMHKYQTLLMQLFPQ
jgi:hypothetical protein